MSEQIKTTTIDQLPEAASLDGLYVFGYAAKNAVGKRSVKAPITLLKGNKGDTGAAGKDGKDGDVTAAQLEAALRDSKFLATAEANGLMSIEQFNLIEDMATNMQKLIDTIAGDTQYPTRLDIYCNLTLGEKDTLPYKMQQVVSLTPTDELVYKDVNTTFRRTGTALSRSTFDIVATSKQHIASFMSTSMGMITFRPYLTGVEGIKFSCTQGDNILKVEASKLVFIDLSSAYNLGLFNSAWCSELKRLDTTNCSTCSVITATDCTKLETANINVKSLRELYFSNCPSLASLTFLGGNADYLKYFNISNTALTKDTVINIESLWTSRVGKDAGVFSMSKTLYDTLGEDLLLKFVNKNITIKFS